MPSDDATVLSEAGGSAIVISNTFIGIDDIRMYTPMAFKIAVLDRTCQMLHVDLANPQFVLAYTALDVSKKDDIFGKILCKGEYAFRQNQWFATVCPGVVCRPSSALVVVKHILTGNNGNITCLSIHLYITNMLIAYNGEKGI